MLAPTLIEGNRLMDDLLNKNVVQHVTVHCADLMTTSGTKSYAIPVLIVFAHLSCILEIDTQDLLTNIEAILFLPRMWEVKLRTSSPFHHNNQAYFPSAGNAKHSFKTTNCNVSSCASPLL